MNQPDPLLGAALRAALEPRDTAAFVARVLAATERVHAPTWEWLERWARRGIAAAAALILATALISRAAAAPASLDDVLLASFDSPTAANEFLVAEQPPDPGAVFADVVAPER